MIALIDGAPEGVLAFKAVGEVHADDYKQVLKPELTGYSAGAAWEDAEIGLGPLGK